MNKLKGSRCYLSGSMENATYSWRTEIQEKLKEFNITFIDPTQKPMIHNTEDPETLSLLKELRKNRHYNSVTNIVKPIRNTDLRLIDLSDFVIVHLDNNINTCGTWEEIFLANRSKKPVIVHCEQGKYCIPLWLFGTLPHEMFFSSWEGVHNYLWKINYGYANDNRWQFFDFEDKRKSETNVYNLL